MIQKYSKKMHRNSLIKGCCSKVMLKKKSKNKFGKKESFFNMKTGVDVLMQNLSKHLD